MVPSRNGVLSSVLGFGALACEPVPSPSQVSQERPKAEKTADASASSSEKAEISSDEGIRPREERRGDPIPGSNKRQVSVEERGEPKSKDETMVPELDSAPTAEVPCGSSEPIDSTTVACELTSPTPNWEALVRLPKLRSLTLYVQIDLQPDLTGLDALPHLKELTIDASSGIDESCMEFPGADCSTGKVDLEPISGLDSLEKLTLFAVQTSDLRPISKLTNLRELRVEKSWIKNWNLSNFSRLKRLQKLDISWADSLRDLSPLASLPALTELSLIYSQVVDLGPLAKLKQLERLRMDNGLLLFRPNPPRYDLTPIAGLHRLVELQMTGMRIKSLKPLSKLKGLELLALGNTAWSHDYEEMPSEWATPDLEPLHRLTNLRTLQMSFSSIDMAAMDALRQALPECYMTTDLPF